MNNVPQRKEQNQIMNKIPQDVQEFWHGLLVQAAKMPTLARVLLQRVQQQLDHFNAIYQNLRALPRGTRRRLQRKLGTSLAGLALALTLANTPVAQAAGITVTTSTDTLDAECSTITVANLNSLGGDDQVSLREAICAANNTAGDDTITLPAGTITLALNPTPNNNSQGNGTGSDNSNAEDDLDIANNGKVTLVGAASGSVIDGGGIDRVLHVLNNAALDLSGVTIQNGDTGRFGGGILVVNRATLNLSDSTLSGNDSFNGGGGIATYNSSTVTVNNSTISGNESGKGAGLFTSGTTTINNSTLTGNNAAFGGGGIYVTYGATTVSNSLISGNTTSNNSPQELDGYAVTSNGNNLFGHSGETEAEAFSPFYGFQAGTDDIVATTDNSSPATHIPTALTDIFDTTLADNGGPTLTHALVTGSPAIDAAPTGPATDQRGLARPQGSAFDIGAFEVGDLNQAPSAEADGPYEVVEGGSVQLDGSGSSDPDQDPTTLTYEWDLDNDGAYDDASGISPTFSAAGIEAPATVTVGLQVTDNGGLTSVDSTTVTVIYDFGGFTNPIDPDAVNQVKGGQTVPVKFSLNGDQGLDIMAAGYPASQEIACDSSTPVNEVEETDTPGNSSLSYDPASDQYSYNWKTEKSWKGSCRQLVIQFDDGSEYTALFQFK